MSSAIVSSDALVPTIPAADPLDCCIISPGLEHGPDTLRTKSLGGSETAAIHMAKHLSARGHHVVMFTPGSQGQHVDGVTWMPIEHAAQYMGTTPHNVSVVSRAVDALRVNFLSQIKVLWLHDLALKRGKGALCGVLWQLDAIYVLSEFARRQALQVNEGIPPELYHVTRNGIDLAAFKDIRIPRDPKKLAYGSRPERGLETALNLMDRLRANGSDLTLHVSSYENVPPQLADYYNALWGRAKQMPNVRFLGSLTQTQWHRELASARAAIYPGVQNEFREISPVHGDTLVETTTGAQRIRDLVGKSGFHVYSRRDDGRLSISEVKGVFLTRQNAKTLKLRFRIGSGRNAKLESALTLTPDHEVMLIDGTYKAAGQLRIGDRVMACTRHDGKYPYPRIALTGQTQRDAHRIVMQSVLGRTLSPTEIVHHKDGNPENNEPCNLEVMTHREHRIRHFKEKHPDVWAGEIERRTKRLRAFLATPEGKELRSRAALERWAKTRKKVYVFACGHCGTQFERRHAMRRGQRAAYCSTKCSLAVAQQYRWGKIASNHVLVGIEQGPVADVFCMEVEPDHNFVADGIVVHNCIIAMEAQAAGTPFIGCNKGALPETVGFEAGILLGDESTDVTTLAYLDAFADAVVQTATSDAWFASMSAGGKKRAASLDWSGVAAEWEADWTQRLRARVEDPWRVKLHLQRTGDLEAMEAA